MIHYIENNIKGVPRKTIVSVMHSCFSPECILHQIISRLNLRGKFGAQTVCRRWKNIAIECLRHHEHLVIRDYPPDSFLCYNSCDKYPCVVTLNNYNVIWGELTDLEFWQRTLSFLQGVKCVYINISFIGFGIYLFPKYKPLLLLEEVIEEKKRSTCC